MIKYKKLYTKLTLNLFSGHFGMLEKDFFGLSNDVPIKSVVSVWLEKIYSKFFEYTIVILK